MRPRTSLNHRNQKSEYQRGGNTQATQKPMPRHTFTNSWFWIIFLVDSISCISKLSLAHLICVGDCNKTLTSHIRKDSYRSILTIDPPLGTIYLICSIIFAIAHIYFQDMCLNHIYFHTMWIIAQEIASISCYLLKSMLLLITLQVHEYMYSNHACNGSDKSSVKFLQKPFNVILFGIRPLYAKGPNKENKSMYQYQKRVATASRGKYCHNCQKDFSVLGPKSFGRHVFECISHPIPIHKTSLKNLLQKQHESETYQYQKRANKINSLFRRETIEETANKRMEAGIYEYVLRAIHDVIGPKYVILQ